MLRLPPPHTLHHPCPVVDAVPCHHTSASPPHMFGSSSCRVANHPGLLDPLRVGILALVDRLRYHPNMRYWLKRPFLRRDGCAVHNLFKVCIFHFASTSSAFRGRVVKSGGTLWKHPGPPLGVRIHLRASKHRHQGELSTAYALDTGIPAFAHLTHNPGKPNAPNPKFPKTQRKLNQTWPMPARLRPTLDRQGMAKHPEIPC